MRVHLQALSRSSAREPRCDGSKLVGCFDNLIGVRAGDLGSQFDYISR
jgi:hypothetical protein